MNRELLQLVRYTRVQEIVGDVIRLRAEGVALDDYVTWQKSLLLDMAFLQQDAFDEIDACMPRERQLESLRLIIRLVDFDYGFLNRDDAREFFTKIIGLYKNWNYSSPGSPDFQKYKGEIEQTADRQLAARA